MTASFGWFACYPLFATVSIRIVVAVFCLDFEKRLAASRRMAQTRCTYVCSRCGRCVGFHDVDLVQAVHLLLTGNGGFLDGTQPANANDLTVQIAPGTPVWRSG